MEESTAKFFAFIEKQNAAIAAEAVRKEALKPEPDHIRLERERERREKWGAQRAREQPTKRVRRTRSVFGYTDLS
jgi:hypothetical protein